MAMSRARRSSDGKLEVALVLEPSAWAEAEDPAIRLLFAEVDRRLVCARIEVGVDFDDPESPDPRPITTQVLRSINLTTLVDNELLRFARSQQGIVEEVGEARAPATAALARKAAGGPEKPVGRPALYDRTHFEDVAAVYNTFGGRAKTRAVAQHFGVSKATAAKWVSRARHDFGLVKEHA